MEKALGFAPGAVGQQSSQHGRPRRWFRGLVATALMATGMLTLLSRAIHHDSIVRSVFGSQPQEELSLNWDWQTIEPSTKLRWYRCYDGELDCARLDVPMDWLSPEDGPRVVLAIARLRATVDSDDGDYRGPVIFNPGGPGGSGIFALRDHGRLLQTIVGSNHDIVAFDPRGIGASVPRLDCWGGDGVLRALWALQEAPVVDAHQEALYETLTQSTAFSDRCQDQMSGHDSLLAYVSTASHARDMLEILEQMGQAKLRYWGFSYGTVLGGTFAAMYPDRVERLVSDGNVDYREWHLGQHANFLRDTDKVMDAFYDLCSKAGPLKCPIHSSTPEGVKDRVANVLRKSKTNPVIVPVCKNNDDGPEMPFAVTYSRLQRAISSVLYRPVHKFESFSRVLAALERGDGRPFWDFVGANNLVPSSLCRVRVAPPDQPPQSLAEDTADAFTAIMCADSEPFADSAEEFREYVSTLKEISSSAGAVNALFKASCAGRTVRPKWRYAGTQTFLSRH